MPKITRNTDFLLWINLFSSSTILWTLNSDLSSDKPVIRFNCLHADITLHSYMKIIFLTKLRDGLHHRRSVMRINWCLILPTVNEQNRLWKVEGLIILVSQVSILRTNFNRHLRHLAAIQTGMKGFSASFPAVCTQKGPPSQIDSEKECLEGFWNWDVRQTLCCHLLRCTVIWLFVAQML